MRRILGTVAVAVGLWAAGGSGARAQYLMPGDAAGFGRYGISNGKGYSVNTPRGVGYYTGLYYPTDNQGPSAYYDPIWSSLNGRPKFPNNRDWSFSPPWSANYRQGQARPRLMARFRHEGE